MVSLTDCKTRAAFNVPSGNSSHTFYTYQLVTIERRDVLAPGVDGVQPGSISPKRRRASWQEESRATGRETAS